MLCPTVSISHIPLLFEIVCFYYYLFFKCVLQVCQFFSWICFSNIGRLRRMPALLWCCLQLCSANRGHHLHHAWIFSVISLFLPSSFPAAWLHVSLQFFLGLTIWNLNDNIHCKKWPPCKKNTYNLHSLITYSMSVINLGLQLCLKIKQCIFWHKLQFNWPSWVSWTA